jgi:hypothetical protein
MRRREYVEDPKITGVKSGGRLKGKQKTGGNPNSQSEIPTKEIPRAETNDSTISFEHSYGPAGREGQRVLIMRRFAAAAAISDWPLRLSSLMAARRTRISSCSSMAVTNG